MKCYQKLEPEERNEIFHKFYRQFTTKTEQDIYLQGQIEVTTIKQRRGRLIDKQKTRSFIVYVMVNGKKIKVCETAFLNLHAISKRRLRRIKELLVQNTTPRELRGQNTKTHAISGEDQQKIREHIDSYPVKESHYSSKSYRYLNERLNIKIMYEMFKVKYPQTPVKYSYFVKFFHENFDLKFGRPQVDTCCSCEQLNIKIKHVSLNENAKKSAEAELVVHKRRAKKFFTVLKNVKKEVQERNDMVGLCFDFMQNAHLPIIPVQDLFYLTQLTVNIFGIHDLESGKSQFYIYHEGTANKGPDEVASFLWNYINTQIDTSVIKKLRLFCDNCPGQNKNHTIIRMCTALVETGKFENIELFYPMRGHSFMPCDRDFGVIKRRLKKYDRIYDLHKYTKIIVKSSSAKKFSVTEVATEDILNFKDWWPEHYKKMVSSEDRIKKKFGISEFHHFTFDEKKPGAVVASVHINSFDQYVFKLTLTKNKKRQVKLPTKKAYPTGKVPILESKIKDIKAVLPYVKKNIGFYEEITQNWPTKPSRKNRLALENQQ